MGATVAALVIRQDAVELFLILKADHVLVVHQEVVQVIALHLVMDCRGGVHHLLAVIQLSVQVTQVGVRSVHPLTPLMRLQTSKLLGFFLNLRRGCLREYVDRYRRSSFSVYHFILLLLLLPFEGIGLYWVPQLCILCELFFELGLVTHDDIVIPRLAIALVCELFDDDRIRLLVSLRYAYSLLV